VSFSVAEPVFEGAGRKPEAEKKVKRARQQVSGGV